MQNAERAPVPGYSASEWATFLIPERALLLAAHAADTLRVRESGRNSGPHIDQYLAACGLRPGAPWCAAFVTYQLLQAGAERGQLPRNSASVCHWVHGSRFRVTADPAQARRGDLFAWCDRAAWRGHIGFIVRMRRTARGWLAETIEGNTNDAGSREGDGVYRRQRLWTPQLKVIKLTEAKWTPS